MSTNTDVNDDLGGTAGLWNFLRISDEKILQATPEIEEGSREDGANSLKDKEPRAWIDISVGLAFESEAERDEKRNGEREIFQTISHVGASWRAIYVTTR